MNTQRKTTFTGGYSAIPVHLYSNALPDGDAEPRASAPRGTVEILQITGKQPNALMKVGQVGQDADWAGLGFKLARIPVTAAGGTEENSTGFILPDNAVVFDVILRVVTQEATASTKTIDIGTDGSGSNDPDGWADGISTATAGIVRPGVTFTAGGSESYVSANTRGVLLSHFLAGGNTETDEGTYIEVPDAASGGEEVTWTAGEAQTEFVGVIYVLYLDLF